MPHVIMYFEKLGDAYVGKLALPNIPLDKLQDLFHMPPEDPMYEMFPIQDKEAKFFCEFAQVKIDISKYDYFLAYHE